MSSVKKLASQTLWYGVPTMASRFIGYLLSILLFRWYGPEVTADITQVYALIPFLNILFTYGLETAYFRFAAQGQEQKLFNTLHTSLLLSSVVFALLLWWFTPQLAEFASLSNRPDYFRWMIAILVLDTLAVIPFARLRLQERPRKYALVKVLNVLLLLAISYYYLRLCPQWYAQNPDHPLLLAYHPQVGIGYYIIANAMASALTLLLLWQEWKGYRPKLEGPLWKQVMRYAYPLIIVGLGGMINEMLSRLVYAHVLDLPVEEEKRQLGIFGASYKVAVVITIFIQIFKMAAEPFFFKQAAQKNAPATYARVMKFFVLACCMMWLAVALNTQLIAQLAYGDNYAAYAEGIGIIVVLAMASVFLGVYYNLSVWYKITNHTWAGAWITLGGAAITILLNMWWIPRFGYQGSAWATWVCYGSMMLISYLWGQRHFPVPYAWKPLLAYLLVAAGIYLLYNQALLPLLPGLPAQVAVGLVLWGGYTFWLMHMERSEMRNLPVVGRFFR